MAEDGTAIDWEQMDMIADGYTPDFLEIFEEFRAEIPVLLNTLAEDGAAGDLAKVIRSAHQIKGSAANFGFIGVSECAAQVESTAKAGSLEGFQERLTRARLAFDQALEELRNKRGLSI